VDPGLAEALKARARKEHRSVSDIARTALREYVERAA
jgi:plasmid stability protein